MCGSIASEQLNAVKSVQHLKLQSQVSPERILDHPSLPRMLQISKEDFGSFVNMLSDYRRSIAGELRK